MDYRAITETGTVYERREGVVTITGKRDFPYAFKPFRQMVALESEGLKVPWAYVDFHGAGLSADELEEFISKYEESFDIRLDAGPTPWEDSKLPVVGHRLYVGGRDMWRISTPIVRVDILEEGE